MPFEMERAFYARMYGSSVWDRVRLGDTNLLVEVEHDDALPGDETRWGFGNPICSERTGGRFCWPPHGSGRSGRLAVSGCRAEEEGTTIS